MNTADYLLENADDQRPVLLSAGEQYTYGQLKAACARLAGELSAVGVEPGDRVGILSENSLFWVAAYLATLKIGAVAVPFPTVSTPDDLRRKEQVVRCRAVCLESSLARRFSNALTEGVAVIASDVLTIEGPSRWDPPQPDFDVRQDAALMLTSGTTALPRAVRITHRNIQANTQSIIQFLELDHNERILVILPFYYCFGTSLLHTHLRAGASMALCNTFAYPETALNMLETTQSTGIAGVPSTFQTLLRNTSFRTREFASLRKVQQAGGKLQPVFLRELLSILPNARIYPMYGQTEATARLSYLPPEYIETKLGSIGRGIPGVTLKIVDESGREVRPGEVGEIVAIGDNVSPGYYEDPEASAEKFERGMLRSGDLATVDEDGFIFIVDRKSDFIKSLGHRVSSQEIEAKIVDQSPDIVAAAAVGQPDPIQGESIIVFVTLRKGAPISPEDILKQCRATMARHMIPKEIIVVESLPTNAHGKVVKSVLRQQLASVSVGA
jgi:long-chain acyl-CoA synthetase